LFLPFLPSSIPFVYDGPQKFRCFHCPSFTGPSCDGFELSSFQSERGASVSAMHTLPS
jgi:hypothetical protein